MKKTILLLVVGLLLYLSGANSLKAQEDADKQEFNTKKWELNIGIADIFAKNYWWYSVYYTDPYGEPLFLFPDNDIYRQPNLILGFKCHGDKGAFRFGTNFLTNNGTYEDTDEYGYKNTYGNIGAGLNVGYEWHSTFGRVNVFYGLDGEFGYTNHTLESERKNMPQDYKDEMKYNVTTVGISPLVGVNFFVTPALSIGTEVKFTGEYMSGKLNTKSYNGNPYEPYTSESEEKRSGFKTYFGPLGYISLNIHL